MLNFFNHFGIWFKILITELANNILSVVLILFIYILLWHFPQALDLLLVLNQNNANEIWEVFILEVPLYFLLLFIISCFVWNSPKYYYKENSKEISFKNIIYFTPIKHNKTIQKTSKYSYKCKYHIKRILPKVLACLVLFISAFAILNAQQEFEVDDGSSQKASNYLLIVILTLTLFLELNSHPLKKT